MMKASGNNFGLAFQGNSGFLSRKTVVAIILAIALIAFEIFNFDTTKFALSNLLGEISFAGIMWATILAIAFCAIDFAGLVRLFTPQRGREEPKAVWFLTGAWFLGTIANAIMTWWAVSLTLLSHEFGNEVLGREALLRYVPIFVAALVWLTRILFIGAFSVAGEDVLGMRREQNKSDRPVDVPAAVAAPTVKTPVPARVPASATAKQATPPRPAQPVTPPLTYEPVDEPAVSKTYPGVPSGAPKTNGTGMPPKPNSRIQQRPPMPGSMNRPATGGVQARPTNRP